MIPLLKSFTWFCNVRNDFNRNGFIDINDDFLNPTQILLFCNFIKENNINMESINIEKSDVRSYFNNVINRDINERSSNSYIPFTALPTDPQKFDTFSNKIYNIFERSFNNYDPILYIFSELSDNIYDHSEFNNAYILAQKYELTKYLDLFLFDDGITIPGSFVRHDIKYNKETLTVFISVLSGTFEDVSEDFLYAFNQLSKFRNLINPRFLFQ